MKMKYMYYIILISLMNKRIILIYDHLCGRGFP